MKGRDVGRCSLCQRPLTSAEANSTRRRATECSTCVADAEDANPVSGVEVQRLREGAQIDRQGLADLLNKADRRDGDAYDSAPFAVGDIRRMEENRVHGSFLLRVRAMLKERNKMQNGISETSMAIQQAHTDARNELAAYEVAEADAQAMVGAFDAALENLREIATKLQPLLTSRRYAYHRAVSSERERAKISGTESTENDIRIVPFRRDGRRSAGGVLISVELWSEMSVTLPRDPDPSESLNPKPDYLPSMAEPVPLRRSRP